MNFKSEGNIITCRAGKNKSIRKETYAVGFVVIGCPVTDVFNDLTDVVLFDINCFNLVNHNIEIDDDGMKKFVIFI